MAIEALELPGGLEARPLPLDRVRVRLRLREETHLGFHHGGLLHRLLERSCGSPPPAGWVPLALESGHVAYAAGAYYDFVLTAVGEPRGFANLERDLRAAGNAPRPRSRGSRCETLEGLFDLVSVKQLPLPTREQQEAKAAALAERGSVRLLLPSPLRLRQPREADALAGQRLGAATFPAGLLLASLWRRYHHLAGLPGAGTPPPLPPETRVAAEHLTRQDLTLRLDRQTGSGPTPATLSGLGGEIVFESLPRPWLNLLVLMEGAHAGTATEFGFGSFAVDRLPAWQRPAATYSEALVWLDGVTSDEAAGLLQPAALVHLDEGPATQCRGLAQVTAELGLMRARAQGLNGPVGGAGDRFVAGLGEAKILARLRSFWPGEPLVELFSTWLQYAEDRHNLSRLLAKVFAVELADALQEEGRRLVRMGSELRVLGRQSARVA